MDKFATRKQVLQQLHPNLPSYRLKQLELGLFDARYSKYSEITTLSKELRESLDTELPWMSIKLKKLFTSQLDGTRKAIIFGADGQEYETVLMQNMRGHWTICVSSQIGCAMACSFCATGTMGFKRNLTSDEIVDQYRFWQQYLNTEPHLPQLISNIVFMGMGEPLANYESVKEAINIILENTTIGVSRVVVSTVGVLPRLEKLVTDKEWPHVKIAVSLHSAITETRNEIVKTSPVDFLKNLKLWAKHYNEIQGNRRHYITFEYIMMKGVNDSEAHADALGKYAAGCGVKKINIIPYNKVFGKEFEKSELEDMEFFKKIVRSYGVHITQRRNMGNDINAACGQLVTLGNKKISK